MILSQVTFVPGHNSITFSRQPIGSEEFLNRMIEAFGITIDRRPKGRTRKRES